MRKYYCIGVLLLNFSFSLSLFQKALSGFLGKSTNSPMNTKTIAITGGTGLIGTALQKSFAAKNWDVLLISTSGLQQKGVEPWDISTNTFDYKVLEGVDAVIHLAGENVASGDGPLNFLGRWSDSKKEKIVDSRVRGTELLVNGIAQLKRKPKVFISASAVGYYGYTDSITTFDEESGGKGEGFLASVCEQWEQKALGLQSSGMRSVCARFSVVLSSKGGIIAKLLPLFNLAAGGNLGSGEQAFSWVSLHDTVRALEFIIENPSVKGPVNICSPQPVTNAGFTSAFGRQLFRPTIFPLPAPIARLIFGQMGEEMLLGGQKVVPTKLIRAGFKFEDETIEQGLSRALQSS